MLKFLLVVLLVAVAIYVVTRLLERRGRPPGPGRTQPRPSPPPRPMGPDDDPDFLRTLEQRQPKPDDDEPK